MRVEVEGLEHHADATAHGVDVAFLIHQIDAVDADRPAVRLLEPVAAAQERALAGARRADHEDELLRGDREVDPLQHLERAEALLKAAHVEDGGLHALSAVIPGRRAAASPEPMA